MNEHVILYLQTALREACFSSAQVSPAQLDWMMQRLHIELCFAHYMNCP